MAENGKAPRAEKGKKLTFSRQLRTMSWRLATSLNRARGKYHEYFLKEKERYRKRFLSNGFKIIPSKELPTKQGKKYEPEGVISLGHLDNMAKRKMIKLFLSHLFIVWTQAEGLPAEKPWVLEHGGHKHFIDPWEMVEDEKPKGKKLQRERASRDHRENQKEEASRGREVTPESISEPANKRNPRVKSEPIYERKPNELSEPIEEKEPILSERD